MKYTALTDREEVIRIWEEAIAIPRVKEGLETNNEQLIYDEMYKKLVEVGATLEDFGQAIAHEGEIDEREMRDLEKEAIRYAAMVDALTLVWEKKRSN